MANVSIPAKSAVTFVKKKDGYRKPLDLLKRIEPHLHNQISILAAMTVSSTSKDVDKLKAIELMFSMYSKINDAINKDQIERLTKELENRDAIQELLYAPDTFEEAEEEEEANAMLVDFSEIVSVE